MRRGVPALIGVGVVVAVLLLGWWQRGSKPGVHRLNEMLNRQSSTEGEDRGWAWRSTQEIAAWRAPILAAVVMEAVDAGSTADRIVPRLAKGTLADQNSLAQNEMNALLRAVAEDLCARASPSVDAYMRLAERQGTRWLAPSDSDIYWTRIGAQYETWFGATVDRRRAAETCRLILEKSREVERSRLAAIGTGEFGLSIRGYSAAHESELSAWRFDTEDQHAYWELTSTLATLVFRIPQPTARECLHRAGSVKAATVAIVGESEGGHRYQLVYTWFLDGEAGRWLLHDVQMKGPPAHALVY